MKPACRVYHSFPGCLAPDSHPKDCTCCFSRMPLPSGHQPLSHGDPPSAGPGVPQPRHLAWWFRLWLVGVGGLLLGLLVVAWFLEPDPEGKGTHQQLGFPPCGFLLISGRPCPSCGMTTAWSHFVRGDWTTGSQANVGGFLLALAAGPVGIWVLVSGLRGTWFVTQPNSIILIVYAAVVILATMIQWLIRIQG